MAIMAHVQPKTGPDHITGSNFPYLIWLCSFKKGPDHNYCVKLAWIRCGWPGLFFAKSIWSRSKPVSKNHWAWFWQNGTSLLPVSTLQTWLCSSTDGQGHTVQNQPGSDLVLADCVMFWPNRSDLEASWHARIIGPTSGQCFWADPDTGLLLCLCGIIWAHINR